MRLRGPNSDNAKNRGRLPSEKFLLYAHSTGSGGKTYLGSQTLSWMDLQNFPARTLAKNVVAFVVSPRNPENPASSTPLLTTDFIYNSRNDGTSALALSQRHQLPPEAEIVMVAIDESSALRAFHNSPAPPGLGEGLFKDPAKLEDDLKTLTDDLTAKHLNFIVLRSTVKIRGARWSQDVATTP